MTDLGFTFRIARGQAFIAHHGRSVVVLRGRQAERFAAKIAELEFSAQQQYLARVTGNFKRGNERAAAGRQD